MKRFFAGISMTAMLLSCGCSAVPSLPGKTANRMAGSFTAEVTVTTADSETHAVLTRYGTNAWCVVFTDPPALDGVQLDYLDDEVKASYKGLEFSVPQSAQALKTEFSELMTVVDGFAPETELDTRTQDDLLVCEGELEVGGYTLALAEDGVPASFSLPAYGLLITFNSFNDAGGVAATETETIPKTYPVTEVTEDSARTDTGTATETVTPTE